MDNLRVGDGLLGERNTIVNKIKSKLCSNLLERRRFNTYVIRRTFVIYRIPSSVDETFGYLVHTQYFPFFVGKMHLNKGVQQYFCASTHGPMFWKKSETEWQTFDVGVGKCFFKKNVFRIRRTVLGDEYCVCGAAFDIRSDAERIR